MTIHAEARPLEVDRSQGFPDSLPEQLAFGGTLAAVREVESASAGMRYIGSKARLVGAILEKVRFHAGARFADLFAGTGVVARSAAKAGWPVLINDHLASAVCLSLAQVTSHRDAPFELLGGYRAAVNALNSAYPVEGFIYRHYSPGQSGLEGPGRRYFSPSNAAQIDGVRRQIEVWERDGCISSREKAVLVADLLFAVSAVANTAGTYGYFMRGWGENALRPLTLKPRRLLNAQVAVEATCGDVFNAPTQETDIAYLDPPYTKRQYAAYYHLLETIAFGDEPEITGLTGLRPWREKASDFCYKSRALRALVALVDKLPSRRIYLSYSSQGHIRLPELEGALQQRGLRVTTFHLGDIGRYRPNAEAMSANSSVTEFLLEISKP